MIEFLKANILTILICIGLVIFAILVIKTQIKKRKAGTCNGNCSSCGCGCSQK